MWLKGVRVCSATTTKPGEADEAGAGWINTKAIARGLNQTLQEVEEEGGLKTALR